MRWGWLICGLAVACSGGVDGGDGNANLGGEESTGTGGPAGSTSSVGTGTSSPSITSTGTGDSTDPGTTVGDPSGSDTSSGSEATGEPSCDENWRVQPVNFGLTDVAYDAATDTVYAVGNDDGTPWAASLDGCNGDTITLTGVNHQGATSTNLRRVLSSPEGLFVAGSLVNNNDPGNGLYARLDPETLDLVWSQGLVGGGGLVDEVLELTVSNAGGVWMAGTARVGASPVPWTISGTVDGSACGFSAGTPGAGSARALATDGDTVVVAMRLDAGGVVLLGYDEACSCMCTPEWTSPTIEIGQGNTSIGDMIAVDGQFYVAGWADDGVSADLYGYVAWLDGNGTLLGTYTDDVTPTGEGFTTMVAVGGTVYLGGAQAWDGQPGFEGANARMQALAIPFGGGAPAAEWTTLPQQLDIVEGIDASNQHLFVGGNSDGVATVLRCDLAGNCG